MSDEQPDVENDVYDSQPDPPDDLDYDVPEAPEGLLQAPEDNDPDNPPEDVSA